VPRRARLCAAGSGAAAGVPRGATAQPRRPDRPRPVAHARGGRRRRHRAVPAACVTAETRPRYARLGPRRPPARLRQGTRRSARSGPARTAAPTGMATSPGTSAPARRRFAAPLTAACGALTEARLGARARLRAPKPACAPVGGRACGSRGRAWRGLAWARAPPASPASPAPGACGLGAARLPCAWLATALAGAARGLQQARRGRSRAA